MTNHFKALVVEDDPLIRMLMQKQLASLGVESEGVGTGEDAVNRRHTEFALIFMDIGLPGIDGIQATVLIRQKEVKENRRRITIVAYTAHSDSQRCLDAGMDDFMQKPASLDDLKHILKKWCPGCTSSA